MPFRTVVVESRCKLEYSLNYLICRKGNEESKIMLDEVKVIVINTLQVSITGTLISELIKKKIKVIFTDEKHNPSGEIVPYQNNYYSYRKIKEQISFSEVLKNRLWKHIVKEKIVNQARNLLLKNEFDSNKLLLAYSNEIEDGDASNREGHAAKVYFNSLFGQSFSRNSDSDVNKFLNYGYSILLSLINREIKSLGFLTELGIHHIGESNQFNLSCDFIEPLRPLIDSYVISEKVNNENFKQVLVSVLSTGVKYKEKEFHLDNAISLYVEDLMNYLKTGEEEKINFIEYEL